jgi:Neuraminidase (sialidase)
MPVVDETGALDIAYALEDCNTGLDRAFFFTRSTNAGASFSARVRIDKAGQFADNPNVQDRLENKKARAPISPSLAYDPTRNRLLFIYQNNIDRTISKADISIQTSDDFGSTWSDTGTVSVTDSGDAAPGDQFFPWLAVDEATGDVFAVWFDNRNDHANQLIETFLGVSTDGGDAWTNVLISDVAWNPDLAFFGCGCFIGDYNGMAVGGSLLYPVWTDGRNSPGKPLGQTDIFTDVLSLT